ncbi:MAG: hypothetical protein U9Q15_00835 [Patescibacteria group bacterium]|nr:hypothetical protein [Patescibacteria group bacterium]
MKFYIYTYGCAMNYSDSERIARLLTSLGYQQTDDEHSSDLYILTTCSVRQRGEDKVIGRVRQLHKERQEDPSRSHIRIALTGCMLHYGERALRRKMPGLDIVFDIKKLLEFPQ